LFYQLKQSSFKQLQRDFKRYYQRQKRQLRDHCYSESKNTEQLVKRMQRISERYARILVVRVDLAYPLNFQDRVNIQTFNDDMRVLRRRLQNQDTIFKGLIEYAWALEQGEEKGYHCHLLLVYMGSERRNLIGWRIRSASCGQGLQKIKAVILTVMALLISNSSLIATV
jgi:hypothetical protein